MATELHILIQNLQRAQSLGARQKAKAELDAYEAAANTAASAIETLTAENRTLRRLLAFAYTGPIKLYTDDGELQDNTALPAIDFKRDPVSWIESSIHERASNELAKLAQEHPDALQAVMRGNATEEQIDQLHEAAKKPTARRVWFKKEDKQ